MARRHSFASDASPQSRERRDKFLDSSLAMPFKLLSMPLVDRPHWETSGHVDLGNAVCSVGLLRQRVLGVGQG